LAEGSLNAARIDIVRNVAERTQANPAIPKSAKVALLALAGFMQETEERLLALEKGNDNAEG